MLELRKPEFCPKCASDELKRIIYGRPNQDGMNMIGDGLAVPGRCFMEPWLPDWQCAHCKYEWFEETDPSMQELEELAERIGNKHKSA